MARTIEINELQIVAGSFELVADYSSSSLSQKTRCCLSQHQSQSSKLWVPQRLPCLQYYVRRASLSFFYHEYSCFSDQRSTAHYYSALEGHLDSILTSEQSVHFLIVLCSTWHCYWLQLNSQSILIVLSLRSLLEKHCQLLLPRHQFSQVMKLPT